MTIRLDHTIVPVRDKQASARLVAGILGLEVGTDPHGYFAPVPVGNGITLDFMESDDFRWHHYAFLVSDEEFDAIFKRVQEADIPWGSDPWSMENRQLNSRKGGRGVYFRDPNGHVLELLTRA